jgi:hypothetical protein
LVTVGVDVVVQGACYGLELIDALTGGPLLGSSAVVETSSQTTPYLVNASRWVFSTLPVTPATFVITADLYVGQTLMTGGALPNPTASGPGYLATIMMMPRTGYPFPATLTRVVGLVQYASAPVADAAVVLTPEHQSGTTFPDPAVTVTTTGDGQFTYWFLPQLGETPPVANQLTGTVSATIGGSPRAGTLPLLNLLPNSVTYAPIITLA